MHKLLLKTILVLLPVLLFVQQQGFAQCTLTCPLNTTVSAEGGKCGAVVTYTPPAVPAGCSSIQNVVATFNFTGDVQTFVVPAGVTSATIKTWGAQGGGSDFSNHGGLGGYAIGTLGVQPGDVLYVYVGGQPPSANTDGIPNPGGYNGGGNAWGFGGGGGGASDVRTGGTSFSNRLIVAGGGGGEWWPGGAGGGLAGTRGENSPSTPGGGGGGGTQTEGGSRGTNGGSAGSFGQGGGANHDAHQTGGGGGYYGGGSSANYGGGGGGSGYVGGVTASSLQTGVNSGNGKVVISYNMTATLSVVQTDGLSSGAFFPVGTITNTFALVNSNGDTLSKCSSTVTVTDNEIPTLTCASVPVQCYNSNGSYSIPALAASDNCGIKSTSYNITGATTRSGTGNNASGAFNAGVSTITWTVTDVHGNQNTCQTTVTVNPQINLTIPDARALSSGVNANTVYIGYTPASSLTLTATASGGSGALTYKWSTGATTKAITVSPTANTVYTVTVTDASGCTAMATKEVKVLDVRCGAKKDKVTVCHKGNMLCVDKEGMQDHIRQGGQLGACNPSPANARLSAEPGTGELVVQVLGNPVSGRQVEALVSGAAGQALRVELVSLQGRVLDQQQVEQAQPQQRVVLQAGASPGVLLLRVSTASQTQTVRLLKAN
jgi:hypothetical protein